MDKTRFIETHFEDLLKDREIQPYLERAETEREREMLKQNLVGSLERSYETYAAEYFDTKGLGSYLSTFLRYKGAATDAVGTYMFWALGGAGFGVKVVGLLEKTLADAIDERHLAKHAKTETLGEKVRDEALAVGEGALERAAAYLPLGVGECADLLRGRSKFDNKVISRAVKYAKESFLDYVRKVEESKPVTVREKEPYMIPLDELRDPHYASTPLRKKPKEEFMPAEEFTMSI